MGKEPKSLKLLDSILSEFKKQERHNWIESQYIYGSMQGIYDREILILEKFKTEIDNNDFNRAVDKLVRDEFIDCQKNESHPHINEYKINFDGICL